MLEHDGTVKYQNLRPTGDAAGYNWFRPATVHDFDGDGVREYATSSATHYSVFERDATIVWTASVAEFSCCAAGTAFDFLGDGVAEAMYADETTMWIYDGLTGAVVQNRPRSSWTNIEYPVVADVDNDGSAEILVVSNQYQGMTAPTVECFRDAEDRWIQPRRIWNQHTYHVTNVREDAKIPTLEQPSWQLLNTYRPTRRSRTAACAILIRRAERGALPRPRAASADRPRAHPTGVISQRRKVQAPPERSCIRTVFDVDIEAMNWIACPSLYVKPPGARAPFTMTCVAKSSPAAMQSTM